ncbi:MAG TPA: hypothetical protein VGS22_12080 [Thermoanaerobaculia bacterium]|jgi:hypothetical protein|nr:hypothetical protein [Thermoanaerobaculia bacterium]
MRQKTYANLASEWDTLLMNSMEDLTVLPHARRPHDELQERQVRLVALNEQIEAQRAALQTAVKERQTLVQAASRPRKALERLLEAEYGDDSQRLVRYGLSPRAPRKRKTKKEIQEELLQEIQKENGKPGEKTGAPEAR